MRRPIPPLTAAGIALVLALTLVMAMARAASGAVPPPPAPKRWVTDQAGLISSGIRDRLDLQLQEFEKKTGVEFIVWIGRSLGEEPLEEWAARTFEAWGIGDRERDNGIALFILAADRRARLEVGYGLESLITDAVAGRILDEELIPRLRAGDADAALTQTTGRLMTIVQAGGVAQPIQEIRREWPASARVIALLIMIALAIFLFRKYPVLAIPISSGGLRGGGGLGGFSDRGGGAGGGGGFSGGGGSSGGGGASRDW